MLESNTDRSWFMIGAVVVGAALVTAALVFFPDVLNLIQARFSSKIGSADLDKVAGGAVSTVLGLLG